MKIYLTIIIGMLLIGTTIAGTISLNHIFGVKDVTEFVKATPDKEVVADKIIKITVDGKDIDFTNTEPDGKYDEQDIESLINKASENGTVTKVELVGVGTLKENKYGDRGFDIAKLKQKECSVDGGTYDKKSDDCVQEEPEVIEEASIEKED